jgi:hypothetical protein
MARDLGFSRPRILQSMLILKQPGVGSPVPPHTDSTFLYTIPTSCVGLWFALQDATPENGCMWFAPGSHKSKLKLGILNSTRWILLLFMMDLIILNSTRWNDFIQPYF